MLELFEFDSKNNNAININGLISKLGNSFLIIHKRNDLELLYGDNIVNYIYWN